MVAVVHNERMNFNEWLTTLPDSPSPSQAADRSGASRATVIRHADKGVTTMEYAVKIARAYNVNEIQALIDMGFVSATAVEELGIKKALGRATNSDILAELDLRTDSEARRIFRAEGQGDVIDLADDAPSATVFDLPTPDVFPLHEDESDAASTAPLEPEEGDDDYHGGP